MERKNTVLLTVIAVATLLVAVVGATFAYFTATSSGPNTSNLTVTTKSVDTISSSATDLTLDVNLTDMLQANGTEAGVPKTSTSSVTINAVKGTDTSETECTYDVTYEPKYIKPVPYSVANTTSKKELTLSASAAATVGTPSVSTIAETDLHTISAKTTLLTGAKYTTNASGTLTWTFTASFYNYNFDQTDLAGKTYGGTIAIENLKCGPKA
jgi:predicted ribosomally synthesized peptide with SipW-like signal peptide